MTDSIEDDIAAAFEEVSNPIAPDSGTAAGAGSMGVPDGDDGGIDDAINEALSEQEEPEKPVEPEAKEESEPNPEKEEVKEDPEPKEEKDPAKEEPKPEGKPERGQQYQPPKRLLPDAQAAWQNVPRAVKRDIDMLMREYDAESEKTRAVVQQYERFQQYDELAKANGRDLPQIIDRVVQIETVAQNNPIAALQMFAETVLPRRADGSALSIFDIAQFVNSQDPNQLQANIRSAMPQAPDPREMQLQQAQQEIIRLQQEQVRQSVIAPFAETHPRFEELQDVIVNLLNSGIVPRNLSPQDRLEVAYDHAVRLMPTSSSQAAASNSQGLATQTSSRVAPDLSGSKSIKSSPGAVSEPDDDDEVDDIEQLLRKQLKYTSR